MSSENIQSPSMSLNGQSEGTTVDSGFGTPRNGITLSQTFGRKSTIGLRSNDKMPEKVCKSAVKLQRV